MTFKADPDHDLDALHLPWTRGTRWYDAILDASDVSAILGMADGSVRQYASKPTVSPGFPSPIVRESGRPNLWTPHQIFEYIAAVRSQARDRIPRLYCPPSIGPAQFLYAEPVTIALPATTIMCRATVEFVTHHWRPADGRGPIALAYPGPPAGGGDTVWTHAAALLETLPSLTAVVLVTDDVCDGQQPAIGVAERGNPPWEELGVTCRTKAHSGTPAVAELGWDDLANLLRVDIPWWPPLLRDIGQMTAWRPGVARQRIRPRTATLSPTDLEGLTTAVPAPDAARVLKITRRMHRLLEGDDIPVLPPGVQTRPGMLPAAEPLFVLRKRPPEPTTTEVRWLLHRQVHSPLIAQRASQALRAVPGVDRLLADTVTIDLDSPGPLAAEWMTGLRQVTSEEATELGFAYTRSWAPNPDHTGVEYYRHRQNTHSWIVKIPGDPHGQLLVSIGTQAAAQGTLTEFELFGTAAFFRDNTGQLWPMPVVDTGCRYATGFPGIGPGNLFRAVRALASDASTNLRDSPHPSQTGDPLWQHIVRHEPPLIVTPDQMTDLAPPHAIPCTEQPSTSRSPNKRARWRMAKHHVP